MRISDWSSDVCSSDLEGRPRLPPGAGAAVGGGLPPGMITEEIPDLDRAGTWLKRSPIDYTPTAFDRYWLPGATLLEAWVRRGEIGRASGRERVCQCG